MLIMPECRKQRQEDCHKFSASLSYIVGPASLRVGGESVNYSVLLEEETSLESTNVMSKHL